MSVSSSSARPSSTFWIIDTTSVSGTFTTTATFTLWVPLNTPSTTPASASTSSPSAEPSGDPRSNTPAITGPVIGSVLTVLVVLAFLVLFYRRRVKRTVVQPRIRSPDTPFGSEHALLDLAAEPAPHPGHIEPWVEPVVVRRATKGRDEALRNQTRGQDSSAPQVQGSAVRTESLGAGVPRDTPQGQSLVGRTAARHTQPSPQVQAVETHDSSATPGSTSYGHDSTPVPVPSSSQPRLHLHQPEALTTGTKSSAAPRRRAPREPSPPRQEEDAGVSLMRAGDDILPPSYGDLVHNRSG
ncbi:hypothetical protein OPQ81_009184 [Rhizoctonia solani]|nr:hypothetical protein OPQ81_009184 [Rhizoctonia solani]